MRNTSNRHPCVTEATPINRVGDLLALTTRVQIALWKDHHTGRVSTTQDERPTEARSALMHLSPV